MFLLIPGRLIGPYGPKQMVCLNHFPGEPVERGQPVIQLLLILYQVLELPLKKDFIFSIILNK